MKYIYMLLFFSLALYSCENNRIINAKALIPLENPAISAYIDVDRKEINVFISTITAFEEKYSFATSLIKNAKVYAKKQDGTIINIPFVKEKYTASISVASGDTIKLFVEWQEKTHVAFTIIPHKVIFNEPVKVEADVYSFKIFNSQKDKLYYWANQKANNETQGIGFSLIYPDKYIFAVSDSVTDIMAKITFFDKNLLKKSPLFLTLNLISIDKNFYEYQTISYKNAIDTRGALKNSPSINNFDNGAIGYFGSLINTEVKIRIN